MFRRMRTIVVIAVLIIGSYLVWPNTWNRQLCEGATVTYKETSNNYYPGVVDWFFHKSPAKSPEAPQSYILHVENGRLFCDSKHFSVTADVWNSTNEGDTYTSSSVF